MSRLTKEMQDMINLQKNMSTDIENLKLILQNNSGDTALILYRGYGYVSFSAACAYYVEEDDVSTVNDSSEHIDIDNIKDYHILAFVDYLHIGDSL